MASKLKIWGGGSSYKSKQVRFLAFAKTKKRIVEMVNGCCSFRFTTGEMNTYWSETHNAVELELVRAAVDAGAEEGVWVCESSWPKTAAGYKRLI